MTTLPDLSVLMAAAAPRENVGSQTQARYNFQANFGILKLVELLEDGQDFRIIFDLFDDIVVIDSASESKHARFYQLKSRDPGDWTIAEVCKKIGKKAPRSIVSRLYAHVVSFGAAVAETGMISNAPYRFELQDGSTTSGAHHRIEGTELHPDEISKLTKAVTADINPADIPSWLPKLAFIRTILGVHGQETVVIGRLQQHLEHLDSAGTVRTSALYTTLHASIVQRTNFFQEGIDRTELISRKSLTRQEIADLFARASARPRGFVEDWDIIGTDLQGHGVGSTGQIKFKTAAINFIRHRNVGEVNAGRLSAFIRDWIKNNMTIVESADSIVQIAEYIQTATTEHYGYSDLERRAAMIVEAYEAINGKQ